MISPININNSIKSNIAPVPKPPKALNFSGLKKNSVQAQKLQFAPNNFITTKISPFAKGKI